MKGVLGFLTLMIAFSGQASELTYGVENQDSHIKISLDFSKNTIDIPSTHLLKVKEKPKQRIGTFKVPADKNFIDLYKILPIAFKKSPKTKGKVPSDRPYFSYKGRVMTSDSIQFSVIKKLFQKIIDARTGLQKGIVVEAQSKKIQITQKAKGDKDQMESLPTGLLCKTESSKKKLCHYQRYTWAIQP